MDSLGCSYVHEVVVRFDELYFMSSLATRICLFYKFNKFDGVCCFFIGVYFFREQLFTPSSLTKGRTIWLPKFLGYVFGVPVGGSQDE